MRVFEAVVRKELVDNARDRRALSTALLVTPLMGPLVLVLMFNLMSNMAETARAPTVPIVGRDNAPELARYLEQQGVTLESPPADPEQVVRDQDADAVIVIPDGFAQAIRTGAPAHVQIVSDSTRTRAGATVSRLEGLIGSYGSQIGGMRLILRGVDPAVVAPILIEKREVASSQAEGAMILGMLPLMLLMACFLGGMYVAIDATAGERERLSLEPLLYHPIRPLEVMLAKAVATAAFSFSACVISVVAFMITLPLIPLDTLGVVAHLDAVLALRLLLLLVPTVFLGSALLLVVGTLSKTFRAAQAAISLVAVGPMIPGMITMVFPQKPTLLLAAIPALGESLLSMQLIRGESVLWAHQLALAATDLLVAGVLIAVAARLFGPRLLND